MEHARPPPELRVDGNPAMRADAWRKWWQQFYVFLKASGVNKEAADVQASLLINLIGAEGYEIFSTFTYDKKEDQDDILCLKKKFDEHFGTKPNVTTLRFKFFTRKQIAGETINQYVTALKILSNDCAFEHLTDGLIRDRIVCGILDDVVRDRLLRTDELSLRKAIQICEAAEMSKEESRQIEEASTSGTQVDTVQGRSASARGGGGRRGSRWRRRGSGQRGAPGRGIAGAGGRAEPCGRCGNAFCEDAQRCPALTSTCYECNGRGHFARVCFNKVVGKRVHNVSVTESDSSEDVLYINMVNAGKQKRNLDKEWTEVIDFNGKRINFKLDTGAMLNVLSKGDCIKLGINLSNLVPYNKKVYSYTGNRVPIIGECNLKFTFNNVVHNLKFVVTDMECQNILGLNGCIQIGVIQRVDTLNIEKYSDLFQGLGKLPGKHRIVVDKQVLPVVSPARRIPLGMKDKLLTELQRMEQLGVVRKVSHPTEWVSPIVIAAKKNGDIRVCLDPRALNLAVRRAHFPLPTVSELAARLRGATHFSVLDARCGFWMMELDEASADLCTFSTCFGRYQFLRLPYGVNCAPEMFHAKLRQCLEDLDGTESFIDDIVIWGCNKLQHDIRLEKLLQRAKEIGLKFNREKCRFCVGEIVYLGHVFNAQGMRPDGAKVKAIVEMPEPTDRKSLERFLGMVNYLAKFIPNYSENVSVLRGLLKKNSEWLWEPQHTNAVSKLKNLITSAPVLALYSNRTPIVLSVDASAEALGAVLLQGGRPVEFASLTLTDTQRRYAQIEKEMLAIVFACERFRQYILGRSDITVQSDHKPLEAIFKKSLSSIPARLQRMMLRIQCYDFKVIYTPGKYMYIADTLSRAPLPDLMEKRVNEELEAQTCFMLEYLQYSDEKLELIKKKIKSDPVAQSLINYIVKGWPRNQHNVENLVREFWSYRGSMQYVEGLVLKDNRVYIPEDLRGEMLRRVHEGHLGIERCKRRAREVMFWPGMMRDVERCVRDCTACALHAPRPSREPMIPHSIPDLPWVKVGSDIFEYRKKYYLILVDYFSNFIEVNELNSIGSKSVIRAMTEQFCRHGIPNMLVTDNGPAYSSKDFLIFVQEWEISHVTSSPMYAQSNGKCERAVRTVKTLLKKCLDSGQDYQLGLLNFRSTPRDDIASPAQLLMGRRLNTRLPVHKSLLVEKVCKKINYEKLIERQSRQKRDYDKQARSQDLPALRQHDQVVVADGNRRRQMKVVAKSREPRSYVLEDAVGRRFRRNRRHIICRRPVGVSAAAQAPPPGSSPEAHTAIEVQKRQDEPCGSKHTFTLPGPTESQFVTCRKKINSGYKTD